MARFCRRRACLIQPQAGKLCQTAASALRNGRRFVKAEVELEDRGTVFKLINRSNYKAPGNDMKSRHPIPRVPGAVQHVGWVEQRETHQLLLTISPFIPAQAG